ncbi:aconitase family-domain-containing protein [Absidia repens]|uniref:Aconitate hydratase, mitochondrial n=1 Tax=Absidia repens TaxID=90262 RepID=A0A1X2I3X5_9FUNG|nr:aconitase family-domain-containing protein [Absidia repens]
MKNGSNSFFFSHFLSSSFLRYNHQNMLPLTMKALVARPIHRDYIRLYSKVAISKFDSQTINYDLIEQRINESRNKLKRPLTLTEKIIFGHQQHTSTTEKNGSILVNPDRVACQDTAAPMVLLQFMNTGLSQVAIPTTVHCDHQVETQHQPLYKKSSAQNQKRRPLAGIGRAQSLLHHEVDDFLAAACGAYNIGLWRPGSGMLHQTVLEKYAYPGSLIIGTDSHMAHAGGIASLCFAVGGAEALDAMVGLPWEMESPQIVGVHLKGSLSNWTTPKDVILKLSDVLSNKGLEKNTIVEYMGSGSNTLSCTGMATICNMGTEIGAMSSVFPYTEKMDAYLRATSRQDIANLSHSQRSNILQADENATYNHLIELDLTTLEPHVCAPFTPDFATPLSKFKQYMIAKRKLNQQQQQQWSPQIQAAHIGSCSNSSYQDLVRSASLAQQALAKGLSFKTSVSVTPGSAQIRSTLDRDGVTKVFKDAGAVLLANACGPYISSWNHDLPQHAALESDIVEELGIYDGDDKLQQQRHHHHHHTGRESQSILSSYNDSISHGMDRKTNKDYFIASPEIVTALAFANSLQFNPMTDSLIGKDGIPFKFQPPQDISKDGIPKQGFVTDNDDLHHFYQAPTTVNDKKIDPVTLIFPQSTRLARIVPFTAPSSTFQNMPILFKIKGKCSAEQISMTGHWLKYRGHLDNLSNNLLIGAVNAKNGKRNWIKNRLTGDFDGVPQTARHYKQHGIPWVLVAEENYGEGSASEHGAMELRYLNGMAIIAKSFAPSHELNLKKQGILPLQFSNPSDYDKIDSDASVSLNIQSLEPGKPLKLQILSSSNTTLDLELNHSFDQDQIHWFKTGSALNYIVSKIEANDMEKTMQEA